MIAFAMDNTTQISNYVSKMNNVLQIMTNSSASNDTSEVCKFVRDQYRVSIFLLCGQDLKTQIRKTINVYDNTVLTIYHIHTRKQKILIFTKLLL